MVKSLTLVKSAFLVAIRQDRKPEPPLPPSQALRIVGELRIRSSSVVTTAFSGTTCRHQQRSTAEEGLTWKIEPQLNEPFRYV
jgi:hypothetical protein